MITRIAGEAGSGRPVVYVPGIDGTGGLLLATAERIAANFRLVRLAFEIDAGPDTYETLATSALRAIDDEGPLIVLAESFGGAVALLMALEAPERVGGLMIVNSFAHFTRRRRLALSARTAHLLPGPLVQSVRSRLARRLFLGRRRDEQALALFRAHPRLTLDEGYRRRLRMIKDLDLRPKLPRVEQPVALFAAEADRIVPAVLAGRTLASGLPNATFEVLAGAGHLVLPLSREPWVERLAFLADRIDEKAGRISDSAPRFGPPSR